MAGVFLALAVLCWCGWVRESRRTRKWASWGRHKRDQRDKLLHAAEVWQRANERDRG